MAAEWFAARLRELRQAKGWTQGELADKAGVSEAGVSQWERGIREPTWSAVLALANALGVTCEAFTQQPGEQAPLKAGRPKKAPPGAGAESPAEEAAPEEAPAEEPPATKPAKRKGKGKGKSGK